jgi:hypothetical protein
MQKFDTLAQEYRQRAEQLRKDALGCRDTVGRTALLELAASWRDLADTADRHSHYARKFLSETRH